MFAVVLGAMVTGLPACNTTVNRGAMHIGGIGDRYVTGELQKGVSGVIVKNSSMTISHGYRGFIADKCEDSYTPAMFTEMMVLGKSLRVTVDVSRLSCGCNGALYMVGMPAGQPGSTNDYYCDANDVTGNWCTEMDLLEANSHGAATTPHRCTGPYSCDRGGCGVNYRTEGYGPGGANIDTTRPFNLTITFHETNSQLSGISSSLTQEGKPGIHTPEVCNQGAGYLQTMTDSLRKGMVLVYTLWGTTMGWLDGCSPNQVCDTSGTVTFSDITIF